MQSSSNNLDSQQVEAERWAAILSRNSEFDGKFVFAAQSTGIYCKPSCPAKHPRRANVVFYSGPEEAEQSGFRPCKRCRPRLDQRSNRIEVVDSVCKYIEANLDRKLTLSELSAQARMSPYHFQRIFKRTVGISPPMRGNPPRCEDEAFAQGRADCDKGIVRRWVQFTKSNLREDAESTRYESRCVSPWGCRLAN